MARPVLTLSFSHDLQLERNVALPPPEALKGKIIIKNKKKHVEKPIVEHALNVASSPSAAPRLPPQTSKAGADGPAESERITLNDPALNDLGEYVNRKWGRPMQEESPFSINHLWVLWARQVNTWLSGYST